MLYREGLEGCHLECLSGRVSQWVSPEYLIVVVFGYS